MHPNAYLRQFWQMTLKPQVFVAMKFGGIYDERYRNVFAPAISDISVNGTPLQPYRVDLSKSGDSILTDIIDGIAHSRFVLADISTVGSDSKTGDSYRSGNVMYEVGIALACRQSHDVLLVRDDHDKFLFDVSTVPTQTINFTDIPTARTILPDELIKRLTQQTFMDDARVRIAISTLSGEEIFLLKNWREFINTPGTIFGRGGDNTTIDFLGAAGIPRLVDKGIIQVVGTFKTGKPAFQVTPLGQVVVNMVIDLPSYEGVEHPIAPAVPPDSPAP